jgi:hypothetical protein
MKISGQLQGPAVLLPENVPQYQLNKGRLGGPQGRSRRFLSKDKYLVPTGIRTPQRPARTPVTAPTPIPRILPDYKYDNIIYLLTATGETPGGNSAVHIYTQSVHRTTQ